MAVRCSHCTVVGIAAVGLMVGCYNYLPLANPIPEPGTYLAVTLTDRGSEELTRHLGPDASVVRGRYLGSDDRGLLVSVSSVEVRRGWQAPWAGETVVLPTSSIASLDVRRLSKGKSVLLVGVGVTALAAAINTFVLAGGGTAPDIGGSTPSPQ